MSIGVCILSFYHGPEWWHETSIKIFSDDFLFLDVLVPSSITPFDVATLLIVFIASLTVIDQVTRVLLTVSRKKVSLATPLLDLSPFLLSFGGSFFWCLHTQAMERYPVMAFLLMAAVFVNITARLLVAHIVDSALRPLHTPYPWALLLLPLCRWLRPTLELPLVSLLAAHCCWATSHYLITVFHDMAEVLGIYLLVQGKRRGKRL